MKNFKEYYGGKMTQKINKDMSITDILKKYPETLPIFSNYNLGCIGCMAASFESLEAGLNAHGIDVEEFVTKINEMV